MPNILITIVGIQHQRDGFRILNILRPNSPLLLLREPHNAHDPNAILALAPIGYVKANQARTIVERIDPINIDRLHAALTTKGEYGATVELSDMIEKGLFHD